MSFRITIARSPCDSVGVYSTIHEGRTVPPMRDATGVVGLTTSGLLGRLSPMTKLTASELEHLSAAELHALTTLLEHYLQMEMEALIEQGARFRAIGRINTLPESALAWVRKVEQATAHLDTLNLTVALSYGGRSEIVDAVRRLAEDVKNDIVKPVQIDEDLLEGYLSTHGLPDPDLLIRTRGETRSSNS